MQKKRLKKGTTQVLLFSTLFIWSHITTRFIQVQDEKHKMLIERKASKKKNAISALTTYTNHQERSSINSSIEADQKHRMN